MSPHCLLISFASSEKFVNNIIEVSLYVMSYFLLLLSRFLLLSDYFYCDVSGMDLLVFTILGIF